MENGAASVGWDTLTFLNLVTAAPRQPGAPRDRIGVIRTTVQSRGTNSLQLSRNRSRFEELWKRSLRMLTTWRAKSGLHVLVVAPSSGGIRIGRLIGIHRQGPTDR